MSTLPDVAPDVKLALRANGTRRILRPEVATCDRHLKSGRKTGRLCNARATHYDAASAQNLCGLHAQHVPSARPGRGRSWYETACASHSDRAAVAIGVDDVARCFRCSLEHEIAQPPPELNDAYWTQLNSGAFA